MRALVSVVRHCWPVLSLSLVLVLLAGAIGTFGDAALKVTATEALIFVILVVGLYIFVGNSGIVSFGHISFMMLGAYATAWQTCCPGLKSVFLPGLPEFLLQTQVPNLPAALLGGGLAATFALVVGSAIMRLSGVAASIAMFALLAGLKSAFENWDSVTGGFTSVVGLPIYADLPVALVSALIVMWAAYLYQVSRFGLVLRASREDEVAARAGGVNVYAQRLIAFVLSAFVVGLSGVLYGHMLGTVAVDVFWLQMTFVSLAMLVVGGMNSLAGAVLGAVSVSALIEILRQIESGMTIGSITISTPAGVQQIALAILLLLIVVFRPRGITGGRELPWPWPEFTGKGRADS